MAQYILNGSAQKISCNCYTLTPEENTKSGSVWNSNKINLTQSFDFWFNVYLGCKDVNGADGIVFILQPISTSIGTTGEGMGFDGIAPSIGIALDTYQNFNLNDPAYDHISIQKNGLINHNNDLAGPVRISDTTDNIEDCKWHVLRISWDASTHWLRTYFDGVLRVEKQIDLVVNVFNNDPNVFWGFSAATGGMNNIQQFCTALNPDFTSSLFNFTGCVPATVQFSDQSKSFAPITNYTWYFGDGDSSSNTNPVHSYLNAGDYTVKLSITGLDGCKQESVKTIQLGTQPAVQLTIGDTCFSSSPRIQVLPVISTGIQYQWQLDGSSFSQQPPLNNLAAGSHTLSVTASSIYQCGTPASDTKTFFIHPIPEVQINLNQVCKDFLFKGVQTDNQTVIDSWHWTFGDGFRSSTQISSHHFAQYGTYQVQFWASASGCTSDTQQVMAIIDKPAVYAGNDTVLIRNQTAQLQAIANGPVKWQPSIGLSTDTSLHPMILLASDQAYSVTVNTNQGCSATSFINIRVYDGPQIYMPNAFSPNADGLNDLLKPVYVGMSNLKRFSIFNRWGQMVFTTTDPHKGWDGKIEGKNAGTQNYIYIIEATSISGQPIFRKGSVLLIQ